MELLEESLRRLAHVALEEVRESGREEWSPEDAVFEIERLVVATTEELAELNGVVADAYPSSDLVEDCEALRTRIEEQWSRLHGARELFLGEENVERMSSNLSQRTQPAQASMEEGSVFSMGAERPMPEQSQKRKPSPPPSPSLPSLGELGLSRGTLAIISSAPSPLDISVPPLCKEFGATAIAASSTASRAAVLSTADHSGDVPSLAHGSGTQKMRAALRAEKTHTNAVNTSDSQDTTRSSNVDRASGTLVGVSGEQSKENATSQFASTKNNGAAKTEQNMMRQLTEEEHCALPSFLRSKLSMQVLNDIIAQLNDHLKRGGSSSFLPSDLSAIPQATDERTRKSIVLALIKAKLVVAKKGGSGETSYVVNV